MKKGKAGTIRFDVGSVSSFNKQKDGTFVVVSDKALLLINVTISTSY